MNVSMSNGAVIKTQLHVNTPTPPMSAYLVLLLDTN